MEISEKLTAIGCLIFFIIVVVAFGITEAVLFSKGTKYTLDSESCPNIPKNKTKYAVKQEIFSSSFHSNLNVEKEHNTYIQMKCPTLNLENEVYSNDKLLSRINVEPSLVIKRSNVYLNDCHGNRIFTIKTGDFLTTLKNFLTFKSSMNILDDQEQILAFVKGIAKLFKYLRQKVVKANLCF